jgi:membrane protein
LTVLAVLNFGGDCKMTIYYIQYIIGCLSSILNKKKNKQALLILYLLFSFLFIFRNIRVENYIGETDIEAYKFFYSNFFNYSLTSRLAFEPGYALLNFLFRIFDMPFEALIIAIGTIYVILFWKSTERYTDNVGVCFFSSLFFFFYYANGAIRQSLAQILAYYAFYYMIPRKESYGLRLRFKWNHRSNEFFVSDEIKYLILSVIACSFHRSAVLLFFIYFFRGKAKILLTVIIFGMATFQNTVYNLMTHIPYLFGKFNAYHSMSGGFHVSLSFRLIEYMLVMLVLWVLRDKNETEKMSLRLAEVGFLIQVGVGQIIGGAYRFLLYTDVGLILFWALMYERIRAKYRILYLLVLCLYVFFRFYRIFKSYGNPIHYGLIF